MKLFKSLRATLVGSLVLLSGAANATFIEFEGSDTSFLRNTFEFSNVVGDVDLELLGAVFSNNRSTITDIDSGSDDDRRLLSIRTDGIGLSFGNDDSNAEIDGQGGNDLVIFSFSDHITFTGISFTNVNGNDDFDFGYIENGLFIRLLDGVDVESFVDLTALLSLEQLTGRVFGIGAVASNDDFKVNGISVVSAPSAAAILGLVLVGFGIRARRK